MARESLTSLSRQMTLICETFALEPSESEGLSPALEEALERTMDKVLQEVCGLRRLSPSAQSGRIADRWGDIYRSAIVSARRRGRRL